MDETSLPLASVPTPVKRPRGRPPKVSLPGSASAAPAQPKRPRGRPRKYATVDEKNAAQRERARRIREMKQRDQEEGISVLEAQAILESFDVDVDVDDEMEGTEMSVGEDAERSSDGDSVFGPTGANITQPPSQLASQLAARAPEATMLSAPSSPDSILGDATSTSGTAGNNTTTINQPLPPLSPPSATSAAGRAGGGGGGVGGSAGAGSKATPPLTLTQLHHMVRLGGRETEFLKNVIISMQQRQSATEAKYDKLLASHNALMTSHRRLMRNLNVRFRQDEVER